MASFTFTQNTPVFVARSVLDSIKSPKPTQWKPSTQYSVGTYVYNQNKLFLCSAAGQSSAAITGPTHSSGVASDGPVSWVGLGAYSNVEGSITNNVYIGFGRNESAAWADDQNPPAASGKIEESQELLNNLTFGLKVEATDVSLGFPKNDWVTGTTYPQYDPGSATPTACIVTNGGKVYKCIYNNGGVASTNAPNGTGTSLIQSGDGYIWKYLGSIDSMNSFKFGTTNYIPVPNVIPTVTPVNGSLTGFKDVVTAADFDPADVIGVVVSGPTGSSGATATAKTNGSGTVTDFIIQSVGSGYDSRSYCFAYDSSLNGSGATATATISAGTIQSITVDAGGSNYSGTATVFIIGDGTGATATATISSGAVSVIDVDQGGTGYTWAKVVVIPGTKGAVSKVVLGPEGGHGSNVEAEIGASAIIISKNVSIGNPNVPESGSMDGSFRQVSVITGVVTETRNSSGFIGKQHPNYSSPVAGQVKYVRGGNVLYVNNIEPITHSSSQEETIKIVLNAAQGICP